jgi:hypothetical protein
MFDLCGMKYKEWQKRPERFIAMTGYTVAEFNTLLPLFKEAHDEYLSKYHLDGKRRKGYRCYVMYRNAPLPGIEERLAFILSYMKLNPIREAHADLFDIEQKQCYESVHGLSPILHTALEYGGSVPACNNAELQELLSERPPENGILLHDGTEREIPRPRDEEAQREKYSGKKKKHTVKNAVIIGCSCIILFVSQTLHGSIHDKKAADLYYSIPAGFTLLQDTGYQGYCPEGVRVIQPQKKPRGKELTEEQKCRNREISSFRVREEHAIGSLKRYRIVKDECRLRRNNFTDKIFLTCAAIHNFRLNTRPFFYENNLT